MSSTFGFQVKAGAAPNSRIIADYSKLPKDPSGGVYVKVRSALVVVVVDDDVVVVVVVTAEAGLPWRRAAALSNSAHVSRHAL